MQSPSLSSAILARTIIGLSGKAQPDGRLRRARLFRKGADVPRPRKDRDVDERTSVPSPILEKLDRALSQVDRPGTFSVSGSVPAILPGLVVEGLGPVGLPLTPKMAKDLIKHCEQAPY